MIGALISIKRSFKNYDNTIHYLKVFSKAAMHK